MDESNAALGSVLLGPTINRNFGVGEGGVVDDSVLVIKDCPDPVDGLVCQLGFLRRDDVEVPSGKTESPFVRHLVEVVGGEVDVLRVVVPVGVRWCFEVVGDERDGAL